MSSNAKAGLTIVLYFFLLDVSIAAYHHFVALRDDLKFWIPQVFLMILIVVTTLYVFYTADLVKETKQLQQRPLIQVSFCELSEVSANRFDKVFEYGSSLSRGVARVVGGEQLVIQARFIVVELKNIGQTTVRNLTVKINLNVPGSSLPEEKVIASDIEKDRTLQVTVAPASVPWMLVQVQSIVYGDGLRRYTDLVGTTVYTTSPDQQSPTVGVQEVT
jgi:Ca2+/Na+ antiporter